RAFIFDCSTHIVMPQSFGHVGIAPLLKLDMQIGFLPKQANLAEDIGGNFAPTQVGGDQRDKDGCLAEPMNNILSSFIKEELETTIPRLALPFWIVCHSASLTTLYLHL